MKRDFQEFGRREVVAASTRRTVALYFALTFAVSWTLWLGAAAFMSRAGLSRGGALFFLPGTFAPSIVALWLSHHPETPGQHSELFARLFRWHVPVRWYVFAASYMIAAKLVAAALSRFATGAWPPFGSVPLYLMLAATIFSTPVQAGEEIGWRGYALPRLGSAIGFPAASIVLGVIWAVWHLPLFLLAHTDSTGQPFLPFALAVIAVSVAMTLLYLNTEGSLLLVMLMHAAINNTTGVLPSSSPNPPGAFALSATPLAWLTVVVLWLGAACFLVMLARREDPQRAARRAGR